MIVVSDYCANTRVRELVGKTSHILGDVNDLMHAAPLAQSAVLVLKNANPK
jgi:hypothetical protein